MASPIWLHFSKGLNNVKMHINNLPIKDIAELFDLDADKVRTEYEVWLQKKRNRRVKPTNELLALLSGLSPASISNFVQNKRGSLSEEKCDKLEKLIEMVGYVPSRAAQNLRQQRRNTIGVALPLSSISPAFYLDMLAGIKQEADILDFHQVIFDITTVQERNQFFTKMPFLDIVDGLIVVGLFIKESQLQIMERHQLPIVAVHNRLRYSPVVANILTINEQALQDLIDQHLIKMHGYHRLALVTLGTANPLKMGGTEPGDWNRVARFEAYVKALQLNGLPCDERFIFRVGAHSFEEGHKAFEQICRVNDTLPAKKKIQAVVCTSDTLAAAILTAARRKGIQIPVTGYDNLPLLAEPFDLTTVDQKAKEVGRQAFRHLFNALEYWGREERLPLPVEERYEMQIKYRGSCGC
jgi:DNA-binding LacI/PurR family transcriptional regulator